MLSVGDTRATSWYTRRHRSATSFAAKDTLAAVCTTRSRLRGLPSAPPAAALPRGPFNFNGLCFARRSAWSLLAVHALRALSWAHMRVWKAAVSCHTTPQRSISRIKHDLHRRNAQSAHSPAKPACGSRAQRLPGRAHVPMTGHARHTRLGTRLYRSAEVAVLKFRGLARVRTMPPEQEESARGSSLWQRARIIV